MDLVIFDSSRWTLSSLGLAEGDSDDYAAFVNALLLPLSRKGITTVVLDNTGHQHTRRSRGTSAKGDLNEVTLALMKGKSFDVDRPGHVFLSRTRTRFSGVPQRLRVDVGGGVYAHPVVVDVPEQQRPATKRELAKQEVVAGLAEGRQTRSQLGALPVSKRTLDRVLSEDGEGLWTQPESGVYEAA
jgi:hypothetical protein